MIFWWRSCITFFVERLHDFSVWRDCMIFSVERLHDFFLRLHDFLWKGYMILFGGELHDFFVEGLHDFFVWRRCMIFCGERLHDFCHSLTHKGCMIFFVKIA